VVRWTNNSASRTHTTTSLSGAWDSGSLAPGQSFSVSFPTAGDYDYHCSIHTAMTGRISVLDTPVTQTPTTTPTPASPVLLGDQTVESQLDSNPIGLAEAFQYTADQTGTVRQLVVYLDASSNASKVVLGLYADSGAGSPSTLLAQGTITAPVSGTWNAVTVPSASVVAGSRYWIAVLQPISTTGAARIRDMPSGTAAQTSLQTSLSTLPATWSIGASFANSPMSAYVSR